MATHHTKYMSFFDHVISLTNNGKIDLEGRPSLFVDKVDEIMGNEIAEDNDS